MLDDEARARKLSEALHLLQRSQAVGESGIEALHAEGEVHELDNTILGADATIKAWRFMQVWHMIEHTCGFLLTWASLMFHRFLTVVCGGCFIAFLLKVKALAVFRGRGVPVVPRQASVGSIADAKACSSLLVNVEQLRHKYHCEVGYQDIPKLMTHV